MRRLTWITLVLFTFCCVAAFIGPMVASKAESDIHINRGPTWWDSCGTIVWGMVPDSMCVFTIWDNGVVRMEVHPAVIRNTHDAIKIPGGSKVHCGGVIVSCDVSESGGRNGIVDSIVEFAGCSTDKAHVDTGSYVLPVYGGVLRELPSRSLPKGDKWEYE